MRRVQSTCAWQLTSPRHFDRISLMLPPLAPGLARVQFQYCGICGSDISQYHGRPGRTYPRLLGHEFVAIVDDVGTGVENVQIGDIVVSDLNYRCGRCLYCTTDRSHLCVEGQSARHTNRGFAGFANLDASYLWSIRDQPLHPRLSLVEPLSCVLHALDWAKPKADDQVLVLGAGGIGLCMLLAISGPFNATNVRFWDLSYDRLSSLERCAAGRVTAGSPDQHAYDVVFDLTGSAEGLSLACDSVRRGGTLCSMSHLDGCNADFLLRKLTRTDVTFKVSYLNGPAENLVRAAGIIGTYWSANFDNAVALHGVESLPEVFMKRPGSGANKEIIDLGAWSKYA